MMMHLLLVTLNCLASGMIVLATYCGIKALEAFANDL